MATDKEKKNWGQVARQGYDQYASDTTAAGEQAANDLSAAGRQQVTDISTANQTYDDSLNEAQRQYRQRMDEGFTQFSDIINAENQRIADERARAEAENKATLQAARWTGATELAASVANLIGVGQFGASNQQYKSYSQDWMKKADADLKYNRARLDNMRDKQRALQQQMIQLRMNDAGHAASMAVQAAGARHQGDVSLAGARYNAAAAPVNIRFQAAEKAAEAKAKGAATEATMGQQKAAQDAQIGLGYARLNAEQADKGYTPSADGKGWTYDATKDKRRTGGGSGSDKRDTFYFSHDGRTVPYSMTSGERKQFLEKAYAKVKDMPGFKEEYGEKNDLRDEDHNGIIMKYAEQNPELRNELYMYSPPEYRKSQEISTAVDNLFHAPAVSDTPEAPDWNNSPYNFFDSAQGPARR